MKFISPVLFVLLSSIVFGSDLEKKREVTISPVVKVYVKTEQNEWSGSGFIFKKDDNETWILTNGHVVDGAKTILVESYVITHGGDMVSTGRYSGHTLEKSSNPDLAIVKIQCRLPGRPVDFATDDEWKNIGVYEPVIMVGCPTGHDPRPSLGIITDTNQVKFIFPNVVIEGEDIDIEPTIYASISCPIAPGNSGGPVFAEINGEWKVVGVASAAYYINGIFIAHLASMVPADQVNAFLNAWREKDKKLEGE